MKHILGTLALMISLFACSGPRADSAGIINGERIPYPRFVRSYQEHTANFQIRAGRAPSAEEKAAIFNETWQNITKHIILKDLFKRYDITVSEQEVIDTLLTNIPESLKEISGFEVDGKFDEKLYFQSVRYDSPVNMAYIRRNYYEYYVPIQKLKERLIDEQVAKSKKSQEIREIAMGTADFDLLIFDPADINPILSDNDIEAYYQKNLERFALESIYSVKYISIPVEPSYQDMAYTRASADSIYTELKQGKSMESIVSERQSFLPGLSALNPGFVRVENVDPALMKILDYLPENSYSELTPVGKGFVIYQKLQRTKSMINYRILQIPPILDPASISAQFSRAEAALNLAQKIGIAEAAEELDIPLQSRDNITLKDIWHSDLAVVEQVNAQLMVYKKGDFIPPIYSTLTGSWVLIQLSENQVNRVRPLADVKDTIIAELKEIRRKTLARQIAEEWITKNPSLEVNPQSDLYKLQQYQRGGIHSEYHNLSLDLAYVRAMQRYFDKLKPQPEKLGDYQIILIPRNYYPSKEDHSKTEAFKFTDLRDLYVRLLEPDWFDNWMQERVNSAKVQIFVKP